MTLEYIAGFLDGEGCIAINGVKSYGLNVTITQKFRTILGLIQDYLKTQHGISSSIPEVTNKCFTLQFGSKNAQKLLQLLLPYLLVKHKQAEAAIEFQNWLNMNSGKPIRDRKLTPEEFAKRREYKFWLQDLKKLDTLRTLKV
jgi:hypothetical protein